MRRAAAVPVFLLALAGCGTAPSQPARQMTQAEAETVYGPGCVRAGFRIGSSEWGACVVAAWNGDTEQPTAAAGNPPARTNPPVVIVVPAASLPPAQVPSYGSAGAPIRVCNSSVVGTSVQTICQ